ncbi:unnamed protein product [Camellia sinensis]
MEGSDPNGGKIRDSKRSLGLGQWMKGQLSRTPLMASNAYKRSDLRLLLGVLGAPLSPVQVGTNDPLPHLCIKDTPIIICFNWNSLNGPVPSNLNNLTSVRELYLSNNNLNGPLPNLTGMNFLNSLNNSFNSSAVPPWHTSLEVEQLEREVTELRHALADKQEQKNVMLQVLTRVEQEQRVTEDAHRFAEQDAAAQRYAAQVLQ